MPINDVISLGTEVLGMLIPSPILLEPGQVMILTFSGLWICNWYEASRTAVQQINGPEKPRGFD